MDDNLIYENIFNRCIFGKATLDEMTESLKYFTDNEIYERCIVIKELIDIEYYTNDPKQDEIDVLTNIINNHKNDLENLSLISNNLISNVSQNIKIDKKSIEDINDLLEDIDDISDDIIYNILESDKLKKEYLKIIYNDIINKEIPKLKKEKSQNLLENYRYLSIKNIKKIIDSSI